MRLYYVVGGLSVAAVLLLFPILGLSHSSGAAPGFTGGPADAGTCQVCHASYEVNSGTGSVSVEAPDDFVPGLTYDFTVTVDNTTDPQGDLPVQGFQLSVQNAAGEHIGELIVTDTKNTRLSGGSTNYVTHTSVGRFESTWTLSWIAPIENVPDEVTIYVAGNAAAGNGIPVDDYIYTTTATMTPKDTSIDPPRLPGVLVFESVYPNPLRDRATVRLSANEALPVTITVYDGLGRAIHVTEAGMVAAGERELPLVLPDLPSGLYLVEVSTPQGALVRPVTVVR